jgi:hypothetical protein
MLIDAFSDAWDFVKDVSVINPVIASEESKGDEREISCSGIKPTPSAKICVRLNAHTVVHKI